MKQTKKLLALLMAVAIFLVSVPYVGAVQTAAETRQMNDNQGDGIILYKDAVPHTEGGVPDGTVDIIIEAMTTGAVTSSERIIPTDIVLVLDVSGSMDDTDSHTEETYTAVYGTSFSTFGNTYYGFSGMGGSYYIMVDGEYVSVSRSNADSNNYYYYRYRNGSSWTYVYPELASGVATNRSQSYPVYQFYNRTATTTSSGKSKMEHLQDAVKNFIDQTLASNAGIANDKDKHRISIVKFADDSYYSGSGATQDAGSTAVGNNFNRDGYNYTQIVKDLTTVNASGAASLKSAVDALSPAGATAIDYGLALAEHALFDARSADDIAGRHEIVVLFTDGSPTHSNGYESDVAAAAINNAKALKDEGVELYTISVAANADSSRLGSDQTNQFCHYVSGNYPNATASGNTISAGTGSPTAGYYWVPDDVLTLDAIFESVLDAVGTPKIELGESAAVIDSLTPYFTLPDGTNSITLQTVPRTASDWGTPESDSNLTVSIVGSRIKVSGFDFDANYISEEPRDGGFYGKMLRIVINVTPDLAVLDEGVDTIAAEGGYVQTNLGNAAVLDSTQTPVAVVSSPGITLNKVTYKLDGQVYDIQYRLPGTVDSVLPKHANDDVATYTDWTTADVTVSAGKYTMPSGDVVFNATSTKLDYTVHYEYRGTVPAGAPALPADGTYKTGDKVTVAAVPSVTGYVFSGWQAAEVTIENGEFAMPSRNVTIIGTFAPSNTVAYKVEHYFQGADGEFPSEPSDFHYHYDGTTGETVNAIIMDYPQFTYADTVTTPSGKSYTSNPSGTVMADGALVLKLYYIRGVHTVTYRYDGTVPANAPALPATQSYRHGETVTLAAVPTLEGYTFVGWSSDGADVIITDGKITMPDRDVTLHGFFLENGDTKYTVEHYLESGTDGVYETAPAKTTEHEGKTNAPVVGEPLSFEGYTYNATQSAATASGNILADGSLTLKLYYDKTPYKVFYQYTGDVPAGAPALPAEATYHLGDVVDVAALPTLEGYTFHGWIAGDLVITNGQFTMPDEDVVLVGYFDRNEASYVISHHFQNENGGWDEAQIHYRVFAHEGELVRADYLTVDGYVNFTEHADTLTSGTVLADGSLELKFFYKRTAFKVTYKYDLPIPAGASALPAETTQLHGATVTVAATATAPGYKFSGWTSETVTIADGKFTMPQSDVVLVGHFTANTDTPWRVEHYKQTLAGTYNSTPDDTDSYTGTTGYRVSAEYRQYEGFTPADGNVLVGTVTAAPDTLVIKLYYERNTYNVTYRYIGVQPDGAPDIAKYSMTDVPYGTTVNLAAKPALEGYEFEGWTSHEVTTVGTSFTMPALDVVILGRFVEKAKYTVTYQYEGAAPAGAPALPATQSYLPGKNVAVASVPTLAGYTFEGWTSQQVTPDGGKFDMPEENVLFTGKFVANSGVTYKVEHYKQNLDGTYPATPADTDNLTGQTGASVTAAPKTYEGFTEDTAYAGRIATGVVLADGSLVLKLYYVRNSYEVTYVYTGTVPADATALPAKQTYKYGEEVTVAPAASADGYTFIGWSVADVTVSGGKFTMPAKNVQFSGSFEKNAPVVTEGYAVVTKKVVAPTGFKITAPFKFEIRKIVNNAVSGVVEEFYVTPGTPTALVLEPGRYMITEVGGDMNGFTHSVFCSVKNGIIEVKTGERTNVTFTNTYVEVQLEKDDHFGYIVGYPDGTVRPENNITRAEVATIFFRMLKEDSRNKLWSTTNTFSDVQKGNWFNTAISTLQNAGVLDGYSDGTFRPNAYITRAELVKIAATFYGSAAGMQSHFSDTSSHWANDFIEAARQLGIVDGYTDGSFRPNQYITRAEAMKIINRTLDRVPHKNHLLNDMVKWVDNSDKSKWYYAEVQEATNSHIYIRDGEFERWVRILPVRDWAALELGWSKEH